MANHSSFASYARDKQAVAEALRAVQTYFEQRHREIASETMRSLLSRLAEDRFNLVVVGQFKRGKSSLINAILGRDVLPTAIVPLTSIITALRYGPASRAVVYREGSDSGLPVGISELADYVTERGNPSNEKRVISVDVEVPSTFLRRGLHVVDTPGIASAYQANTATTYAFLPEADAVIFVTSVESPLTEAELSFVDTIRQSVERVFFVLNKVDQVTPAELTEVLTFTENLLRERVGTPALRLFPVSARQALEGKLTGERGQIDQSGLPAFEEALAAFLRAEREVTLLRAILDRARRLLAEDQHLLTLLQGPSHPGGNGFEQRSARLGQYLDDLMAKRNGILEALAARRTTFVAEVVTPALTTFRDTESAKLSGELTVQIAGNADVAVVTDYQNVRAWLLETLGERQRTWLTAHAAEWEAAAAELLRLARQGLDDNKLDDDGDSPSGRPEPSLSLSHGLPEQPPPYEESGQGCVSLSADQPENNSLLLYLPRPIANRALRHRLVEDLDRKLVQSTQAMQSEVERYLDGVIDLIRRETDRTLQDLRRALEAPTPSSNGQTHAPPDQAFQAETLIAGLTALRDALGSTGESAPLQDSKEASANHDGNVSLASSHQSAEPVSKGVAPMALEVALRGGSCPICTIVRGAVWEFLCHWQYALATDEAARQVFRADGGFCNEHTWALEAVASPRGMCVGYPPLLDRLEAEVGGLADLPASTMRDRLRAVLPDTERCRLCAFRRQREGAALSGFASLLESQDGRKAYLRSPGLCLPHLQALLGIGENQQTASFLVEAIARHLSTAAEDMRSYALKVDARRRDLITPPEEQSSVRVPTLLTGDHQGLRRPD